MWGNTFRLYYTCLPYHPKQITRVILNSVDTQPIGILDDSWKSSTFNIYVVQALLCPPSLTSSFDVPVRLLKIINVVQDWIQFSSEHSFVPSRVFHYETWYPVSLWGVTASCFGICSTLWACGTHYNERCEEEQEGLQRPWLWRSCQQDFRHRPSNCICVRSLQDGWNR